nr:helix-turn-helix domain-containing protein [Fulvivirga imtechensis]
MIQDDGCHQLEDISFPDGCLEIIFNMGAPVFRATDHKHFVRNPSVELIGQMTQPFSIRSKGKRAMLGIRFYPHTAHYFIKEGMAVFNDEVLHPADLFGSDFLTLSDQVFNAPGMAKKVAILESFLITKLDSIGTKHQIIDHAVKNILTHKNRSDLNSILIDCGISARYLQKLFLQFVGISPKMFIKIIRFQNTFKYLMQQEPTLTSVAYDCGYFDQSHFIRDFKLLSGACPTRFLAENHPYNSFFLQESNRSYLFDY